MTRWCLRCGYEYRSTAEMRRAAGCPKCSGMVSTNIRPVLAATAEKRERATAVKAERR